MNMNTSVKDEISTFFYIYLRREDASKLPSTQSTAIHWELQVQQVRKAEWEWMIIRSRIICCVYRIFCSTFTFYQIWSWLKANLPTVKIDQHCQVPGNKIDWWFNARNNIWIAFPYTRVWFRSRLKMCVRRPNVENCGDEGKTILTA